MNTTRILIGICCAAVAGIGASQSPLADAAMNKDFVAVRALLKQKAEVNSTQADGTPALMWAVRADNLEMVDLLLAAGANVNARNREGATALYQASVNGNAVIIERLLKAGADVNSTFLSTGETALMEASRTGDAKAVKALLDHGAQVNAKDLLRETTPLMWAASQDHPEIVKLLIEHGADPNAQSKQEKVKPYGTTGPGAQTAKVYKDLVRGGLTPLVFAAREGYLESAKALLDGKADINKTTADGSSALVVAIQNGHYEVGRFLVERGANINLTNQKGWSPLYLSVKNRTIETGELPVPGNENQAMDFIKLLLDRGAEVNTRLAFETETHAASHVIWLKEEGATPFFRAAYGGDLEVLKLLLAHGADSKIPTADHTTPLMALVGVGYTIGVVNNRSHEEDMQSLKLLLDLGADVNAANDLGLTALMGAAHRGLNDVIQILVDHGAKLDARDKGTYCGYGRKDGKECPGGVTALSYAEGLPVTGEAPVFKPETAAFVAKLMADHGVPIPKENLERGGGASK